MPAGTATLYNASPVVDDRFATVWPSPIVGSVGFTSSVTPLNRTQIHNYQHTTQCQLSGQDAAE